VTQVLGRVYAFADGYKTVVDVRLPDPVKVRPPATGWPCVLLVHPLAQDRNAVAWRAKALAGLGYVTIAYDVRGQGATVTLNSFGGSTLIGGVEKADMAELLHAVHRRHRSWIDFDRLAVVGTSQGGGHAWAAAARSGQPLPKPRGKIQVFPTIRAVSASGATPDWGGVACPEGNAFGARVMLPFFAGGGNLRLDPEFAKKGRRLFLQQDISGWAALWAQASRDDTALLSRTRVPVFAFNWWDDWWMHTNGTVDVAMPAGTPRFVHLGTGAHGSPPNVFELSTGLALERRWLDHFLKGVTDDLPQQPGFLLAVTPDDPATYMSPTSIWQHRQVARWPRTGRTAITRLWLRRGGRLASDRPATVELPDRLVHKVATGFGPKQWIETGNQPQKVFRAVPLSSLAYRSDPSPRDQELHGRATARISVTSSAPNLQLGVALFDEDGHGRRRYVTGGFRCIRGRLPGNSDYRVALGDYCYILRKGHRWTLAVENHAWHRPPGMSVLRTVPYFVSYELDVEHTTGRTSFLELPLLPVPALGCRANRVEISRHSGGPIALAIDGAGLRARAPYCALIGFTGTVPGTKLGDRTVPLNFDALTSLGWAAFPGFLGLLDERGRASPMFQLLAGQLPADWVGRHLTFNALSLDASGLSVAASSQVRVNH